LQFQSKDTSKAKPRFNAQGTGISKKDKMLPLISPDQTSLACVTEDSARAFRAAAATPPAVYVHATTALAAPWTEQNTQNFCWLLGNYVISVDYRYLRSLKKHQKKHTNC